MLMIRGPEHRSFCDGLSRRSFLKIGGLTLGGLALPDILRQEAHAGVRAPHKAVIMIYLPGGPPHIDLLDMKPDAPVEIRGEFKPIPTNVPGIQITEQLPRVAAVMDKLTVLRSVVGCVEEHAAHQCLTGYGIAESRSLPGGRPSLGAYLSKLRGPVDPAVPPFVGLCPKTANPPFGDPGGPGFLGRGHAPFTPFGEGKADMVLKHITLDRLADRTALLHGFDTLRRDLDAAGTADALDAIHQRALDVLTSSKLVEALDLSREDPRVRDRYGPASTFNILSGAPLCNDQFLAARRLVEAGVRCVTLAFSSWDTHRINFQRLREYLPRLDQALSALVQDLRDRGLDRDVSVVVWGEFGRTPRINKDAGRDHWPAVSCALLAGGGMRTGQVIGATNRLGEYAKERPVHMQEVLATLYHNLGIDAKQQTVTGPSGRPMYLLGRPEPIHELL
jgi:hypothetical protein